MKKLKIFPKTFLYTFALMLFITALAFGLTYLFAIQRAADDAPIYMTISDGTTREISTALKQSAVTSIIANAFPLSLLCCVFVSLVFSILYSKAFTIPIKRISSVTERMARLEKSAVSDVRSRDEIGVLSENINELAKQKGVVADIAIRINPNVDAHTHHYITTGLEENKFGISQWQFQEVVDALKGLHNVRLISLHFHVGSQITDLNVFEALCLKVNEIQDWFKAQGFTFEHVDLGGGLGIDYVYPNENPIANFADYFAIVNKNLKVEKGQKVHFEIGRAIVGQCGNLITKVVYVKHGQKKSFAIVDAGMTDLIRPALYQAYHKIENITSTREDRAYDVVGPICESSDCFAKNVAMAEAKRGDLFAIRSAGAYSEIMASQYNLRKLPEHYYSDEL